MRPSPLTLPLADLPDPLAIPRLSRAFDVSLRPPGSKSITNRALLLAALARGTSTLRHALTDADDAQVMLRALRRLGAGVEVRGETVTIAGVGGSWRPAPGDGPVHLDLHNAGTATRFLAAAALLAPAGSAGIVIDGNARMRQRPIAELASALRAAGATVRSLEVEGFPPLHVLPLTHTRTLEATFGRTASSQFISALLLAAPFLPRGLRLRCTEELTSPDYVDMTLRLLRQVGVPVTSTPTAAAGASSFEVHVPHHVPAGFELDVEPDASGATYFLAAAAMTPGARCSILGLPANPERSLQGDARFPQVLRSFGAEVEGDDAHVAVRGRGLAAVTVDLSRMPDTAMTAAVVAAVVSPGPTSTTTLRGLRTLRVKETDRLAALQAELTKIGCRVQIEPEHVPGRADESLVITPATTPTGGPVTFNTYDDHRMAMSLALLGLRREGVLIADPRCVAKTYPTFFQHLSSLYA